MNIKNKFIVFYIFFSILTLSIINIKNPEKTKFYLFTSRTEVISLGNLITITFLSGFTFSSLLTLLTKNSSQKLLDDNLINDEESNKTDNYNINKELDNIKKESEYDRPPERDIRESQPTVTVNYRFVDQKNNTYSSKNIKNTTDNLYNDDNDWFNNDNEW